MSDARYAASGALWSATAGIANQALSLLVFVILARLLDPASYGLIALAMAMILLLSSLAGLGLQKLLVQLENLDRGDTDSAFVLALGTGSLLAALLWWAAPWIAGLAGTAELEAVIRALLPLIILKSLEVVPRGLLVREFGFRAIAIRSILASVAGGIAGITLAVQDFGVWSLVAQETVKAAISLIALWWACDWLPGTSAAAARSAALLRSSLYFMGTELTRIAQHQLDRLLIGSFLGIVSLGVYAIASKVNRIAISILQDSLAGVGLPTFARARGDLDRLRDVYYQSQRLGMALTMPLFVLLLLTAESIVPLLLGEQWQASAPILQALCLASCGLCVGLFNTPLLQGVGRSDIALRMSALGIVSALAAFFLAMHWGVLGVSLAFAIRTWLLLPVEFYLCQRFANVPAAPAWRALLRQLLTLAPMVIAVGLLGAITADWPAWSSLIFTLLSGGVVYLACLAINDRALFTQIVTLPRMLLHANKD
jgi:PST family polysaccharide transporter